MDGELHAAVAGIHLKEAHVLAFTNTMEPWNGERIAGKTYPPNIETLWSDAELKTIGLARVERLPPASPPTRLQRQVRVTREIVGDRVVETPVYEKLPNPEAVTQIKIRAREIILDRFPDWKQANMTARAVELVDKKHTNALLSAEEEAEEAELYGAWGWIKAVRARSDDLEAAYAADKDVNLEAGAIDGAGGWPQ